MWTHHTFKGTSTPWRSRSAEHANKIAKRIVEHSDYCALVVPTWLPDEIDETQYALLADGDTRYVPVDGTERFNQ